METLVRAGLRKAGWAIMAIAAAMAVSMIAWVPPELAAMLGSRFSQSRTDPATLPARRPSAARVTRRGSPRTPRADGRPPKGPG